MSNFPKGWNFDLMFGDFFNTEYDCEVKRIMSYWKVDDREAKQALWEVERKAMHALNEKPYHNGRFGSVSST